MDSLNFNSVETLPNLSARAAFQVNSSAVFKEDVDIGPVVIDDTLSYVPWGGDNNMPFDILKLIEDDETLSTCQMFNAEVCFGSGLRYDTCLATAAVKSEVEDFFLDNDIASYYLGVCQDFKHFGFAVSVIILSRDGTKIVRLLRKEACYCRFAPAGKDGRITRLLYANWRKCIASRSDIEVIELLDIIPLPFEKRSVIRNGIISAVRGRYSRHHSKLAAGRVLGEPVLQVSPWSSRIKHLNHLNVAP